MTSTQGHEWALSCGSTRPMLVSLAAKGRTLWQVGLSGYRLARSTPRKPLLLKSSLSKAKPNLKPASRAMPGNLGYYAGVDRVNNAMSNVSIWDSIEAANQMATFQPMLNLAEKFVALGVRFQRPILNFITVWALP